MLRKVFISFASFAVRTPTEDLDGAKFSKLCKDAKLLGRNLSTIEVDIVFAKVKVWSNQLAVIQQGSRQVFDEVKVQQGRLRCNCAICFGRAVHYTNSSG